MIKYIFQDSGNELLQPGIYAATIVAAEEKISRAGNETIELTWRTDEPGPAIYDYLVFSQKTAFRIDQFLKATGHAPEKGKEIEIIAENLIGWRAWIKVEVESGGEKFADRNRISRYVTEYEDKLVPPPPPAEPSPQQDEDIPF